MCHGACLFSEAWGYRACSLGRLSGQPVSQEKEGLFSIYRHAYICVCGGLAARAIHDKADELVGVGRLSNVGYGMPGAQLICCESSFSACLFLPMLCRRGADHEVCCLPRGPGSGVFSFFLGSPEYNGQGLDSHENHWALKNDKVSQNQ